MNTTFYWALVKVNTHTWHYTDMKTSRKAAMLDGEKYAQRYYKGKKYTIKIRKSI